MAGPQPDHYSVLEVPRTATNGEIRAAYRRMAREHHPDANPGAEAERLMRRINEAWETLRDPQRRSQYDRLLPVLARRGPPGRTAQRQPAEPAQRPPARAAWFAEDAPRAEQQSSAQFTGDPSVDWYAAVGVRPDASRQQILKALSRMAESLNGSPVSATEFTRRKNVLREAWTVLGNQYVRASYDRARKAHASNASKTPETPAAEEPPPKEAPPAGYRIGPVTINGVVVDRERDLRGADLRGGDFRGLDLAGANFREARLQGADFEAASLRGAAFAAADLSGANLKYADLSNADCQGAGLRQADLTGAALHATNLFRANLAGCSLTGAVGPGINLDFADLARADFSGAKITPQLITRGKLNATIMPDGTTQDSTL